MAVTKTTTFTESNISATTNTSSLTINIYFSPNNTQTWFASKTLSCTCNGVTQSANVSLSTGGSVSHSFTFNNIVHNTNGTKSVSWSWSCATGTSVLGTIGDSGTKTLTTIPRYFSVTPTLTLVSKTETSYTFKWTTSETCSYVRWHFDGSSTWHDVGNPNAKTGTFTVNNGDYLKNDASIQSYISIEANTSHGVYAECRRSDSGLWSNSNTSTNYTYDYPHCSETPNFIIGEELTLQIYNPLSRSVVVNFIDANDNELTEDTLDGTTISGFNDVDFIDDLYTSIPNSSSGAYKVKVTYEDISEKIANNGNTYSVNGTETPTFTANDFDYVANLTNLTQNSKTIIDAYSTITFSIVNEATPKLYSSIVKYMFVWGNKNVELTDTTQTVFIEKGSGNTLTCIAVDSRGLTTQVSKTIVDNNYVQYINPTINSASTKREDGIKTTTKLNMQGNVYNGKYGVDGINNVINSAKYSVSSDNETWSNWYNIPLANVSLVDGVVTISDYNIHANGTNGGFSIGDKYYVRIYIDDALGLLGNTMFSTTIPNGKIARDVYKDYNNEYHEGINGLANEDYTQMIHGTLNVRDNIYINGEEIGTGGGSGGEALPIGSEIDFDGNVSDIPDGWEQVEGFNLTTYMLYDNDTGTTGNITLSDDASNYNYIEIFYKQNQGFYGSIKVHNPDGKSATLMSGAINTGSLGFWFQVRTISISGTSISNITGRFGEANVNNNAASVVNRNNNIYITQVVGYKEE